MKQIKLKSLHLRQFKGIKSFDVDFSDETTIYGKNGSGKTTLFDAFTWLLFGKDSSGVTAFEIKPLDAFNRPLSKTDHIVEAVLLVDNEEVKFKRTFREKWVKKRGEAEATFEGNETLYEWNDVEMTKRDYEAKINEIIDESLFKLITDPSAFNNLKWQDRREVLLSIVGIPTNQEIAGNDPEFQALLGNLSNKSLEEYTMQLKSSIRKSKDELKNIPARIDEVQASKPIPTDFIKVRERIAEKEKELNAVLEQITDRNKAMLNAGNVQTEIRQKIQVSKNEIEKIYSEIDHAANMQYSEQKAEHTRVNFDIRTLQERLNERLSALKRFAANEQTLRELLASSDASLKRLREKWVEENAKTFVFDRDEAKCPACQRAFDSDKVDELASEAEKHFNEHKRSVIAKIDAEGKSIAHERLITAKDLEALLEKKASISTEITTLGENIADAQNRTKAVRTPDLEELKNQERLKRISEIDTIRERISGLEKNLTNAPAVDLSDLTERRTAITESLDKLKGMLAEEGFIKKANERIEELMNQESSLAQTVSNFEKELHTIEQFTKKKIGFLEASVNKRFKFVRFKLFEMQVNGAEVPTCVALVNGVPFSGANTASKINAGIDIINTLCVYHGVTAPIWIDNRESVTSILPTASQVINLVVSPEDEQLRIKL